MRHRGRKIPARFCAAARQQAADEQAQGYKLLPPADIPDWLDAKCTCHAEATAPHHPNCPMRYFEEVA